MPEFKYDANRGQFKGWLRQIARRRIVEHLRRSYRENHHRSGSGSQDGPEFQADGLEAIPDPASEGLDELWEREWDRHLADLALKRIKRRVRPEHYQIFELLVLQEWPVARVAKALEVSLPMIYVTRHRVQSLLKKEIQILQNSEGCPGDRRDRLQVLANCNSLTFRCKTD